jgi:hypothetical protein
MNVRVCLDKPVHKHLVFGWKLKYHFRVIRRRKYIITLNTAVDRIEGLNKKKPALKRGRSFIAIVLCKLIMPAHKGFHGGIMGQAQVGI